MKICVYGASSNNIHMKFIEETENLGYKLARRGHTLVFGGGANGLMGAAARGVTRGNGEIIGVAPTFFNVDGVLYEKCTKMIPTETMRERKQIMEDHADAFIMVPGGIGTFEEFFEILTLKQLARHAKPIAILNVNGFYDGMFAFMQQAIDSGFMKEEAKDMYEVFTDADALLDYLETDKKEAKLYKDIF